ncbi:MAG TPA: glycosyltransferase [Anaerolineales bacterium]|nr:glycosyltransferase [Anaerolineales bacterium]
MRIAYVSLHWPRTRHSGVGKKIQSHISTWQRMGHETRLFMHTSASEPSSELIEADYFFYAGSGRVGTEIHRVRAAKQMLHAVRSFQPDIIFLRYGMYVYPAHRLAEIAPVVEEINTNDLSQHEELGLVYSLYNRFTRGIFLRRVHGLVVVSHELAASKAFASFRKPTEVIANGIELDAIQPLPAPRNETPHLVFIATPGYFWHGVDKLLTLARLHGDLTIHVVGYDIPEQATSLPPNVYFHGYLNSDAYVSLLGKSDVAISTLALHRKAMQEASPLKTRECLAYGLPTVIAYTDTDLDRVDFDFLLKIPNKEDNIQAHAHAIREFAYRMRGCRADRDSLRPLIDARQKEAARLAFFEKLLHGPA